jgi:hypothetical protein
MATRWGASARDLHEVIAPSGLGLSCQTSTAAVGAAHAAVAAFTSGLALRVDGHASGVTRADASYLAHEADATSALAAVGG